MLRARLLAQLALASCHWPFEGENGMADMANAEAYAKEALRMSRLVGGHELDEMR